MCITANKKLTFETLYHVCYRWMTFTPQRFRACRPSPRPRPLPPSRLLCLHLRLLLQQQPTMPNPTSAPSCNARADSSDWSIWSDTCASTPWRGPSAVATLDVKSRSLDPITCLSMRKHMSNQPTSEEESEVQKILYKHVTIKKTFN